MYKNFSNATTSNNASRASRANFAHLVTKAPPPRFVVISLAAALCRRAFILNTKIVKIFKRMRFVITGVNRLTHEREVITRDLTYAQAMAIMARERRKRQRAWLRLRAERLGIGELKIKIEEPDNESN